MAMYTKWPGWNIDSHESHEIARPAARILARHSALGEVVKAIADPVALVVASAAVMGPRIVGYQMAIAEYKRAMAAAGSTAPIDQRRAQRASDGQASATPTEPPTKAAPNGATAVNFAERLVRDEGL